MYISRIPFHLTFFQENYPDATWSIAKADRLLSTLLQQEKEYCIPGLVHRVRHRLGLIILLSCGRWLAVDEGLKRYALGVDEWRETIRSLKNAEEEVRNIMRDWEILCVVSVFLPFFFVCLQVYFFQSDPVDQCVQLVEKRGRQHLRVPAPKPPAIPVVVFTFLVCCGRVPLAIAFSCVHASPYLSPESNHFL